MSRSAKLLSFLGQSAGRFNSHIYIFSIVSLRRSCCLLLSFYEINVSPPTKGWGKRRGTKWQRFVVFCCPFTRLMFHRRGTKSQRFVVFCCPFTRLMFHPRPKVGANAEAQSCKGLLSFVVFFHIFLSLTDTEFVVICCLFWVSLPVTRPSAVGDTVKRLTTL